MFSVGTEGESDEVALMGIVAETRVGKICELIRIEIQNGDRLPRHRLLRAIAVVEHGGIMTVWTEDHRPRKAVGAADAAGAGDGELLACWKVDGLVIVAGRLCMKGESDEADNSKSTNEV